jgi:signal transduction histidine kinase
MPPSWRRFADLHPRLVESALLLVLYAATARQYAQGPLGWWGGAATAAGACLALLWRRRAPGTVTLLTAVCTGTLGAAGYLLSPLLMLPLVVALYELAARSPQRAVRVCGGAAVAVVVLPALLSGRNHESWKLTTVGTVFWLVLPLVLGAAVRGRQAYLEAVRARAEEAERTREEEARHRVAQERVRIARDLHVVVAHHLALANAQAGTAAYLARARPREAEALLGELSRTTAAALRELKAAVGLLRRPEDADEPARPGADPDPDAPLEPAPGLARLPGLVAAFAAAGLHVTVTAEGPRRPLPPVADLTGYRIVQEALTNVAKHAGVDAARVRLVYGADRLVLTVSDEGRGGGPSARASAGDGGSGSDGGIAGGFRSHGGFGMIGMRERAEAANGRLRAGPRPEGGFAVTVELPLDP